MVNKIMSIDNTGVLTPILLSGRNHVGTGIDRDHRLAMLRKINCQDSVTGTEIQDPLVGLRGQQLDNGTTQGWDKGSMLGVHLGGPFVVVGGSVGVRDSSGD